MRRTGLVASLAALVLAGCASTGGGGSGSEPDKPDRDVGDKIGAQVVCEDFVERRLRSPATADFSGAVVRGKGPRYVVVGQVDSENGFGALIRNTYRCKVRSTGGDRYRLVKLSGLAN